MLNVIEVIRQGLRLTSLRGRATLGLSLVSQIALSGLDAVSLYLLATSINFSGSANGSELGLRASIGQLLAVVALFIARSLLSTAVGWLTARRLAKEETRLGIESFQYIMTNSAGNTAIRETHLYNSVDRGPEFLMMMLQNALGIISEALLVGIVVSVFLFLEPLTGFVALAYFGVVAFAQHSLLSKVSAHQGDQILNNRNSLYDLLSDAFRLRVVMRADSMISASNAAKHSLSRLSLARATSLVLSYTPRYLLEITFVAGIVTMGATAYVFSGIERALSSLILFTGISFRLLPVVNRVQSLALTMLAHAPIAREAFVKERIARVENRASEYCKQNLIELERVCFHYGDSTSPEVLHGVDFNFEPGKQYAIAGPSGSGKTTLLEILLGFNQPTSGTVKKSENLRIAYVPQHTHIATLTLAENVALLWDQSQIDFSRVLTALQRAGLDELTPLLHSDEQISNDSLSGGQKQRIGLARAFYQDANFLVLDEITSALDGITESSIISELRKCRGTITTVLVAHRLSSIQFADEILYLDEGKITGSGSFSFLLQSVPKFRQQMDLRSVNQLPN